MRQLVGRARHSCARRRGEPSAVIVRGARRFVVVNPNASVPIAAGQRTARPTIAGVRWRKIIYAHRAALPVHSVPQHWRRAIIWAVDPYPIFHPFTQSFADGVHQDVARLFFQLVLVAQAVVKEIALPFDAVIHRCKFFPVGERRFHSRITRKCDDGMQMVGHQQAKAAMPDELSVVMRYGCENGVASAGLAELVFARWNAFDGDEEPAAFGDPLRDCVRQLFADGQIHVMIIAKRRGAKKRKVGRGSPLRAVVVSPSAFISRGGSQRITNSLPRMLLFQ